MTRTTILFVCYGGGHVKMVLPLLRRLGRDPGLNLEVLALTTAAAAVRGAGFACHGFGDLVRPEDAPALEHGERLLRALGSSAAIDRNESRAYLGLSYAELEATLGAEAAAHRYALEGRRAFLPVGVVGRLIEGLRPGMVVATSAPRAERAAIVAARGRGVPAVCMVDLFLTQEWRWVAAPEFADRICVIGEAVKRFLIEKGRPSGDVRVTGNPAFDQLARPDLRAGGVQLRHELGWADQRVILWALPGGRSAGKAEMFPIDEAKQELFRLLAKHEDLSLILRPHPNAPIAFGDLPPRARLSPTTEDVQRVLYASDLVFTEASTVGLEASLLGMPVITFRTRGIMPYADLGLTADIDQLDQLEAAILTPHVPRLEQLGAPPLGRATARVEAVLRELL